jgi:tRNA(Arg) A34 adenosine deaminase TadA
MRTTTSGNAIAHQEIIWLRPFKEFREIAVHIRKLFVLTSGNASAHQEIIWLRPFKEFREIAVHFLMWVQIIS